ncbi:MAG TPA: hypothetical protein VMF66_19880 [Candidatus Acidoferrum sp.]|nr:hypothetical protein [Candidatus Acidoferrum sp.]
MADLDGLLYQWICRANTRRDDLDLPVGLIEESIALLKGVLGSGYLESLLITETGPVHFLDDEANPLRKWLLSAMVEAHIIQVLELAAYFKLFQNDAALPDKVEKLKRDRFWPMFFELAMAARLKRASRAPQKVRLNPESPSSVGDFTINAGGYDVPCECSRLGHSPAITAPQALLESLSNRISEGTRRVAIPLCIKIRSTEALTGDTYNHVLRLVRRSLADAREPKLPTEHTEGRTKVTIEELTGGSEQIPFQMIGGVVTNVLGTDWDSATRLCSVPAKHRDEITDRFEDGERFYEHETVRLFIKFGPPTTQSDNCNRLAAKLKKKLKQTKISTEHFGKIVLIEVPFDLRAVDATKLNGVVHEAAVHSSRTFAVILANREPNPHLRYHYSLSVTGNQTAAEMRPKLLELLDRASKSEATLDPILGLPYRRSWAEAQKHAREVAKPSPD